MLPSQWLARVPQEKEACKHLLEVNPFRPKRWRQSLIFSFVLANTRVNCCSLSDSRVLGWAALFLPGSGGLSPRKQGVTKAGPHLLFLPAALPQTPDLLLLLRFGLDFPTSFSPSLILVGLLKKYLKMKQREENFPCWLQTKITIPTTQCSEPRQRGLLIWLSVWHLWLKPSSICKQ